MSILKTLIQIWKREPWRLALICGLVCCTMMCQAKPQNLVAVPIEEPAGAQPAGKPGGDENAPHDLFNYPAGSWLKLSNIGAIDPVGTALADDFDGDALPNSSEDVGNPWVGDYPVVESVIQPPITMEIVMQSSYTQEQARVSSNISSMDIESKVNSGMENFHRNQLAKRTEKIGKSSSVTTGKFGMSLDIGVPSSPVGLGLEAGASTEKSEVRAVFETIPHKDDMDRRSASLKKDSAQTKSRNFRKSVRENKTNSMQVSPNSGLIRAALNIENLSVNMPVRVSRVTCSLVFESPTGTRIPVQSFILRNQDYSIFSVEIYGGASFGPYVIELNNLNTQEIENAIASGYTPKIYIIDYEMTHVKDSNYRAALANHYTGDNVKIIEENVKGRSFMVKLIGPNIREKARVAAFRMENEDPADACFVPSPGIDTLVSPGISLKRALERMVCRGGSVEFDHYVFDFTGSAESLEGKFYMRLVKSLHGIANTLPCEKERIQGTDAAGSPVSACVVRLASMDTATARQVAMWAVFPQSRHFNSMRPLHDASGNQLYFDSSRLIPMYEGVDSSLWVGDLVEVVYLNMAEILNLRESFGTNPLETGETLHFNTRWNQKFLGDRPFDPDVHSQYLGTAGLGDKVEFEIELRDTSFLNPKIGSSQSDFRQVFDEFSYQWAPDTSTRFDFQNAFDFEISFGLGGAPDDWHSITRTADLALAAFAPPARYVDENNKIPGNELSYCGRYWNYIEQKFTVCVQLPKVMDGIGPDGIVSIFIRPSPNNAYREVIWPVPYAEVKRFDANLAGAYPAGSTQIELSAATGDLAASAVEAGTQVEIGSESYAISSVAFHPQVYRVYLASALAADHLVGQNVTVGLSFSGYVKTAVSTGASYIDVVPYSAADLLAPGVVEKGKEVDIAGTLYFVSSVENRPSLYTVTLDAPLRKDHIQGERFSVKGDLTRQQVALQSNLANQFFIDWNNEHPAGGLVPERAPLLYENATVPGCAYGLDILFLTKAPVCQGALISNLVSNWAGGGSFDNNWADAANYTRLLQSPGYPSATASTGSVMRLASLPENLTLTGANSRQLAVANWGELVVVAWSKQVVFPAGGYEIVFVILDPKSGEARSPEISVSRNLSGANLEPKIAISGDRVVVVWNHANTNHIYANVFDLTGGLALLPDAVRVNDSVAVVYKPDVYVFGDSLYFLWGERFSTGERYVFSRFSTISELESFASSPVAFVHAPRTIHANLSGNKVWESAVQDGNTLLVLWRDYRSGVSRPWGRYIDLANSVNLSKEFEISAGQTGTFFQYRIALDQGKAVFTAIREGAVSTVKACFIEISLLSQACQVNGTSSWLNLGPVSSAYSLELSADQGRALAAWHDAGGDFDIYAALIDTAQEQLLPFPGPAGLVNRNRNFDQLYPVPVVSGNQAAIYWYSLEASGWSVRAAYYDLSAGIEVDHDIRINTSALQNTFHRSNLERITKHNMAVTRRGAGELFFFFASPHGLFGQNMTISGKAPLFPMKYGLNNYFVSPLVERNYLLKARLRWD